MSERQQYTVILQGCDDSTEMDVELTDDEAALIRRLCELSKATSTYQCMPTMVLAARAEPQEEA